MGLGGWGGYDPYQCPVTIWTNNTEVFVRGEMKKYENSVKARMVSYYNMWLVMKMLQNKINFKI